MECINSINKIVKMIDYKTKLSNNNEERIQKYTGLLKI
jgi:hypothetical protein